MLLANLNAKNLIGQSASVESADEKIDFDTLRQLTDAMDQHELEQLQDELDFCRFTGAPSPRVLRVLSMITELDAGWKKILDRAQPFKMPAAA